MKIMDRAKELLDRLTGKGGKEVQETPEIFTLSERDLHPPVASYANPNAPMTLAEMKLLVPLEIWDPKHPKHNAVFRLLHNMERFLEDSRIVSRQQVDRYKNLPNGVSQVIRIRGIQEQMGAIRFRLDSSDYENVLEREILKNRLYELYQVAKELDPDGVARYERHIDKQMRKARARA